MVCRKSDHLPHSQTTIYFAAYSTEVHGAAVLRLTYRMWNVRRWCVRMWNVRRWCVRMWNVRRWSVRMWNVRWCAASWHN